MSLVSLLSIARSALLAHQKAMTVTAHNVANAQTPGYSRQRVQLSASIPQFTPFGALGRGVDANLILRVRDRFLDANARRENAFLENARTQLGYLGQIEAALDEPSESGIAAAMDQLFQAFGDLANEPSSGPNREMVRQAADRLVRLVRQLDTRLTEVASDAVERMQAQVDDANSLARKIADLNGQILAAGGAAHASPDLEDMRDALVDQLSGIASVQVVHRNDGSLAVVSGGVTLVDGSQAETLSVQPMGGGFGVGTSSGVPLNAASGTLKALTELSGITVPNSRGQLNTLAATLVTEINTVHLTGFTSSGLTNVAFFDPAGLTAATFALSTDVSASAGAIAASSTASLGDGGIALQLAGGGSAAYGSLGGRTVREYYVEIASRVGIGVRNAQLDVDTHEALLARSEEQRLSVSGVSVDEEMANLISQQQAYGAAARLIRVAEEMMDDLMQAV